jgi:hypothetical protein
LVKGIKQVGLTGNLVDDLLFALVGFGVEVFLRVF